MSPPQATSRKVYQLKVTLRHSKPPIWRRLLVPGAFSLHDLHQIIQIAMGWSGYHLHQFTIDGEEYGVPSPHDWTPVIDERRKSLRQVAPAEKRKFVYEYDFGDGWEHDVLVEKILPAEPGIKYPVCVKGKRACPPEDVGGVWGYEMFLEALSDPEHEEHDTYVEWSGGGFDSEALDLDGINAELQGSG